MYFVRLEAVQFTWYKFTGFVFSLEYHFVTAAIVLISGYLFWKPSWNLQRQCGTCSTFPSSANEYVLERVGKV